MVEKNNKVLLGMSGGTDSSVAAILLMEAGYEVTGITFRFYEKDNNTEYIDDAVELCRKLGIKHLIQDERDKFQQYIISYFIKEYMSGRTPVPCTLCNNYLKWPMLEEMANSKGIYNIATGHYVQKTLNNEFWHITSGADPEKDQSFFLWGLPQKTINRMILPLGKLTKKDVRDIALKKGFMKAATKRDSLGVCFCPMDYRSFIKKHVDKEKIKKGLFYDEKNNIIGEHQGYPFYTIGQRRGLGIYMNKALFVKEIYPEENKIIISDNIKSLEKNELWLTDWNIINPDILLEKDDVIIKIRYRKQANKCTVTKEENGMLHVRLHEPLASIAPGQAAAFYRDDMVLGGGIIW